jgi:hypothetical protein
LDVTDIFIIVTSTSSVSGLPFRAEDFRIFQYDVSMQFRTTRDRLEILSLRPTKFGARVVAGVSSMDAFMFSLLQASGSSNSHRVASSRVTSTRRSLRFAYLARWYAQILAFQWCCFLRMIHTAHVCRTVSRIHPRWSMRRRLLQALRPGRSRHLSPRISCLSHFHPLLPLLRPSCCLAMRASHLCTPRPATAAIPCRVDTCAGHSVGRAICRRKTHPAAPMASLYLQAAMQRAVAWHSLPGTGGVATVLLF